MIVVGRDLSPFVRRVMVSLKLTGLPHEQKPLATTTDMDKIRAINPLARVPCLLVEGEDQPLVDSWTILDYIDEQAGPEKALIPAKGRERRAVLRLVAMAMGAAEKAVQSFYERTRRPAEKQHKPWLDHLDGQVAGGLGELDKVAAAAAAKGWPYLTGQRITQADVSAVVALEFVRHTAPYLAGPEAFPALGTLAARLDEMPAFKATSLERFK